MVHLVNVLFDKPTPQQVRLGNLVEGKDSGVIYVVTRIVDHVVYGCALYSSAEIRGGMSDVIVSAGNGFRLLPPGTRVTLEQD